jgi:Ran GTPase-activating protein (RanGAP) involved in mRNA processing and transport
VQALASALSTNSHLRQFKILKNRIGDVGITSFAAALKVNEGLQALDVTHNTFTSEGAIALGEALYHNQALRTLFTCKNPGVGEEGHQGIITLQVLLIFKHSASSTQHSCSVQLV